MKALVYQGPGKRAWKEVPKPAIQNSTDAIVRIRKTTICGTDLHIMKGDVPTVAKGRILGHEGVGVVERVGDAVSNFKVGDKALISCITSCGKCGPCKDRMYSHCASGGGWILGHLIDGTQAEYVRIPFADTSLYHAPKKVDEEGLVMFSDVLPTGFECGVLSGEITPGDTVAVVGVGPIGLASILTAQFYAPAEVIAVDMDKNRLRVAKKFGATRTVDNSDGKAAEKIMKITGGQGVDVSIEAVGIPKTFDVCQKIVKAGGVIANVGVHGEAVSFEIERLWSHNIKLTTRLVDTETTSMLLRVAQSGKIKPKQLITHHFKLKQMMAAYDTFGNAAKEKALKMMITA